MAAPKYTDRLRAQKLRSLTIDQITAALNGDDEAFKKALLLRLAGSVLPRLNEHTGEDGEPINVSIINYGNNTAIPFPAQGLPDTSTTSTPTGK